MDSTTPCVEYRAQGTGTFTRVYRYENGTQQTGALYAASRSSGDNIARELNVAVATGVRLAAEHLDRAAVIRAIREFPFDDFGLDDLSVLLAETPDTQEWVDRLADDVIRALGGTCA